MKKTKDKWKKVNSNICDAENYFQMQKVKAILKILVTDE